MAKEVWKKIEGFEKYQVSNLGIIKSSVRSNPIILKPYINSSGYHVVYLSNRIDRRKNSRIHRLVAKAFIKNPDNKKCINHIDGNKINNDVSNLEWVNYSENIIHAYKLGLRKANTKNAIQARLNKIYETRNSKKER